VRRRLALIVGAVVCLVLAAALFLLAADIGRWQDAMAADDVRYRTDPGDNDLWQASTDVPFGLARKVLGVGDDIALREAIRAFRLGALETGATSDPEIVLRRGEARARLQEIAGAGGDARRRSRAMNLLGVLAFSAAINEARNQVAYIGDAVASFQGAIALDQSNVEAKTKLELALQKGRQLEAAESAGGPNPSPGGSGAKGAGAGTPGSGY
jgi:hypothetical protein